LESIGPEAQKTAPSFFADSERWNPNFGKNEFTRLSLLLHDSNLVALFAFVFSKKWGQNNPSKKTC
jgi:hypothetical protein